MTHEACSDGGVGVLVSGGVDSAVLCIDLVQTFRRIHPIYVRFGLRWEDVELAHLRRFLDEAGRPELQPLTVLDEPVADVYGPHWSTGAAEVPDASTPDEAVYLPGRNLLLTAKAGVWCRLRRIGALALGSLNGNPFPDSSPEFFRQVEAALDLALGGPVRILRPYQGLSKADVLERGRDLPLQHTFSCLSPVDGLHCGACNKCAERRRGFDGVGRPDPTAYALPASANV